MAKSYLHSYSTFDEQNGFTDIVFTANKRLLEYELNELQAIQNTARRALVSALYTNGILEGQIEYVANNTVRIRNAVLVLDGEFVHVDQLSLQASAVGTSIYIYKKYQEVKHNTTLTRFGNKNSADAVVISNRIKDARLNEETSSRIQVQYALVTSTATPEDADFYQLGYISTEVAEGLGSGTVPKFIQVLPSVTSIRGVTSGVPNEHSFDGGTFTDTDYSYAIDGGAFTDTNAYVLDAGHFQPVEVGGLYDGGYF